MVQAATCTEIPISEAQHTASSPGPVTLACRHTPSKYSSQCHYLYLCSHRNFTVHLEILPQKRLVVQTWELAKAS